MVVMWSEPLWSAQMMYEGVDRPRWTVNLLMHLRLRVSAGSTGNPPLVELPGFWLLASLVTFTKFRLRLEIAAPVIRARWPCRTVGRRRRRRL